MNYNKLPKDEPFKYVKLANPKLEQHETLWNGMPNYNIKYNIMAKVNNIADKTIYDAIIKYATEQGITDLFLIDEDFVKSALLNEMQRREKPRTNFDKITESVESLTEFFERNGMSCDDNAAKNRKCHNQGCTVCIKEWLQQEAEDEN